MLHELLVVDANSSQSLAAMLPVALLKAINPHIAGFRMFHLVSCSLFFKPNFCYGH